MIRRLRALYALVAECVAELVNPQQAAPVVVSIEAAIQLHCAAADAAVWTFFDQRP